MENEFEHEMKKQKQFLTFFFIVFVIACFFFYQAFSAQSKKINMLEQIVYQDVYSRIDLTKTSFQDIPKGFEIAIKNVDVHLTGIKIKGEVLNTQSVDYENLNLTIEVGQTNKDFTINKLKAGYAAEFEIYIPDIPVSQTKTAMITYNNGVINFYR